MSFTYFGYSFSNLFYSSISVIPILIFNQLKINGIIITILTNSLEVIRLQYIHQFIGSYVEKSLNSPSQQSAFGSGSDTIYNNILPIVIDPISMAIKISKEKGEIKTKNYYWCCQFYWILVLCYR
ncbi:hypothetical protein ACTFIV_001441 [Dictyostelium citrinum]